MPAGRARWLTFYSAKGGVGTSVVAATTALLGSAQTDTLLVDLAGDQPQILGISTPSATLPDWFGADAPHPDALARDADRVSDRLSVLTVARTGCLPRPDRLRALAQLLSCEPRTVVVDLGRMGQAGVPLIHGADRSLLVTRPCYLAVHAAMAGPVPDGVVLVAERGRPLRGADIEAALGVPVVVEIAADPAVARAVDAGVLKGRIPRSLRRLEELW